MSVFVCSSNSGKINEFQALFKNSTQVLGLKDFSDFCYKEPLENSNYFIANGLIKLLSALKFLCENDLNNKIDYVVVDDSGLCVPQFNFNPGVHSAFYGGLPRDEFKNRKHLMEQISANSNSIIFGNEKRLQAFFVSFVFVVSLKNLKDFSFLLKYAMNDAQNLIQNIKFNFDEVEKSFLSRVNLNLPGGLIHKELYIHELKHNISIYCGYCCGEVSNREQNLIPGAGHGYDSLFYSMHHPNLSFASISLEEKNKISHRGNALCGLKF